MSRLLQDRRLSYLGHYLMPGQPIAAYVFNVPKCALCSQWPFFCREYLQSEDSHVFVRLWVCSIHVSQRNQRMDGSGGREYPGGLVINSSPTKKPSPAVLSPPSGLGEPAAVIRASPLSSSSPATTTAALCSSCPAPGSVFSPGESRVMPSKVAPSSPTHSPVWRANTTTTSMRVRRSSNAVAPSACIPGPRPRRWSLTLWLSFWVWETFDATAVVIGVISSAPLALGDRTESIKPRWCQDDDCWTMVSHILNRMRALAWLARLICLPVRDSPSTRLWSMSYSGLLWMLHHSSVHSEGSDVCRLMWYPESPWEHSVS